MPSSTPRLNKRDWQIINSALALLQADADDDYKRGFDQRLKATREKVHNQLARYKDPYNYSLHRDD